MWDTPRCTPAVYHHRSKRTIDYIQSFLAQYKEGGRLPVWELSGCETDCMIGYHSVSVITDAYMKGLKNFDASLALQAMQKAPPGTIWDYRRWWIMAWLNRMMSMKAWAKRWNMRYDDWCIGQFAKAIGRNDVGAVYFKRAQAYKNILDVKSGFMRPGKMVTGSAVWSAEVNNNFTRNQQLAVFVLCSAGYQRLYGIDGRKQKLEQKLDALFSEPQQNHRAWPGRYHRFDRTVCTWQRTQSSYCLPVQFAGKAYKTRKKIHQSTEWNVS